MQSGTEPLSSFIFSKEVKFGKYRGTLPPSAVVANRHYLRDPRAMPVYAWRTPYVVASGKPSDRLIDKVVSPLELLTSGKAICHTYYIEKQLIPALRRVFNTLGPAHGSFHSTPHTFLSFLESRRGVAAENGEANTRAAVAVHRVVTSTGSWGVLRAPFPISSMRAANLRGLAISDLIAGSHGSAAHFTPVVDLVAWLKDIPPPPRYLVAGGNIAGAALPASLLLLANPYITSRGVVGWKGGRDYLAHFGTNVDATGAPSIANHSAHPSGGGDAAAAAAVGVGGGDGGFAGSLARFLRDPRCIACDEVSATTIARSLSRSTRSLSSSACLCERCVAQADVTVSVLRNHAVVAERRLAAALNICRACGGRAPPAFPRTSSSSSSSSSSAPGILNHHPQRRMRNDDATSGGYVEIGPVDDVECTSVDCPVTFLRSRLRRDAVRTLQRAQAAIEIVEDVYENAANARM